MIDLPNDLVVVIRSADERTTTACKKLVLRQVPQQQVHVVREFPFEAALRRCYEIGIESGTKWMMTLDADVLLRDGAIQDFLAEAEALPSQYFQVEGLLHDKLTGQYRKAGHRMYRTQYLETALQHLPEPRKAIRPEFTTLQRMQQYGYLSKEVGIVFGVHDYEQLLSDIYRKSFVHAQKHPQWIPGFIERWRELADQDSDFRIALRGLYDGLMAKGRASIDKRDFISLSNIALKDLGLSEKNKLLSSEATFDFVHSVLVSAGPVPLNQLSLNQSTDDVSLSQQLSQKYAQLGLFRFFLYSFGTVLSRTGQLLKHKAQICKMEPTTLSQRN